MIIYLLTTLALIYLFINMLKFRTIFYSAILYTIFFLTCLKYHESQIVTTTEKSDIISIISTTTPKLETTNETLFNATIFSLPFLINLIEIIINKTNVTIPQVEIPQAPVAIQIYFAYFLLVCFFLCLSKISIRKVAHGTTIGFFKYIISVIYKFIGLFINLGNYRMFKRTVTHVLVPNSRTTIPVRRAVVQSGKASNINLSEQDPSIISHGPPITSTPSEQGESVAPPKETVQPQGKVQIDKPVNQHVEGHGTQGDSETNVETTKFSQFSIVKAPAITSKVAATTNCDDIGTMSLTDLLSKNFLIDTFNISAADAAWSKTASFRQYDFPTVVAASKQFKTIFKNYQFARFDVQLKFILSGSVQQTGLFAATVVPYSVSRISRFENNNEFYRGLSHPLANNYCLLRPNKESVAIVDVPWISNRNFMEDNRANTGLEAFARTYDLYSSVHFNILIPLASSTTGASSCTVSVYASITNLRADVMAIPQMFDTVSNVTIDKMRDSTLPVNMTGQALDFKASVPFGMDKPSDTRNYEAMYSRTYQNFSNAKSTVVANRMSLVGHDVNLVDTTCFKTDNNAMSLDAFKNTWFTQYIEGVTDTLPVQQIFTWSATQASGSLICSFPVSPTGLKALGGDRATAQATIPTATGWDANGFQAYQTVGQTTFPDFNDFAVANENHKFRHSPHSFIARQFNYWCGTMKYRMYMASNMWYNGKLFVHISYGTSPVPATITAAGDDPRTTYGFELNANSECAYYDFEVPFRHPCKMAGVNENIAYIAVYVDQPLKANNGMPSSLQFMFVRAWGDDFVLSDYSPYQYQVQSKDMPQGWSGTYKGSGESLEMCGSYRAVEPRKLAGCIGIDRFISMKQLMTVPWHIGNYISPAGGFNKPVFMINLNKLHECGFMRYMSSMYAGYKGSLRLIFRFHSPANPLRITYFTSSGMTLRTLGGSLGTGDAGNWNRSAMDVGAGSYLVPTNNYVFDLDNPPTDDVQCINGIAPQAMESTWLPFTRGQSPQLRSVWVSDRNPETVIEIPFRHNKTFAKTYLTACNYGTIAVFNPAYYPVKGNWNFNFELCMLAGDDFQYLLPTFSKVGVGFEDANILPINATVLPAGDINYPPNVKIIDQISTFTSQNLRNDQPFRGRDATEYGYSFFPPTEQTGASQND